MVSRGTLIIFTRLPVPGKTKTRLIPALGEKGSSDLHKHLLLHTVQVARKSIFDQITLCVYPDAEHSFIRDIVSKNSLGLTIQQGKNLGERMSNAINAALSNSDFAVLTGCDCPELNASILDTAYSCMSNRNINLVLGPSQDGGYYLIGMNKPEKTLFQNIDWGRRTVTNQTRKALLKLNWQWQELEVLRDIDEPEDLEFLTGFQISPT